MQSSLIGIVVPAEEVIARWAASQNIHGTFVELCRNPAVKALLLSELQAEGKAARLHSFEQVTALGRTDPHIFRPFKLNCKKEKIKKTRKN